MTVVIAVVVVAIAVVAVPRVWRLLQELDELDQLSARWPASPLVAADDDWYDDGDFPPAA